MRFSILSAIALVVSACSLQTGAESTSVPELRFGDDGRFKIVQFTDTHVKMDDETEYAKAYDHQVWMLETEKPDLVVFTGDVVTEHQTARAWAEFLKPCDDRNIPFVVVLGNHDREQELTEEEVAQAVTAHPMSLNTASQGFLDDLAVEVKSSNGDRVAEVLYCMDSNDYNQIAYPSSFYGWFSLGQVDWYRARSREFREANAGVPVPSLAFFHIPLREYREAFDSQNVHAGVRLEHECDGRLNTGMFSAFVLNGDVQGVFTGHDHDNDYVAELGGISLAYGRFSGRNTTYNDLPYGSRVIELTEGEYGFKTWIRLYQGGIVDEVDIEKDVDYVLRPAVGAEGKEHGLLRTEYAGNFECLDHVTSGEQVSSAVVPSPGIVRSRCPEPHGYVMEGLVYVPESGVRFFHLTANDLARLSIDDVTVEGKEHSQMRVNLEKGFHRIRLVCSNFKGDERFKVQWRTFDEGRYHEIPNDNFYVK